MNLLYTLLFVLIVVAYDSPENNIPNLHKPTTRKPARYTTKTHGHSVTRTNKGTTAHPKNCHSFNIFCIPCKIGVNVIRMAMDRVVFVHKTVESLCTHILGRHFICDGIIKVTMFYLDHTPTENICKRFFLCSNNGFFDWWNTKIDFPENSRNFTLWKVLNARDQIWEESSFQQAESLIDSFFEKYRSDVNVSDLPDGTVNQLVDFILTLKKASSFA